MWYDIKLRLKWWVENSQEKSKDKSIVNNENILSKGSEVGMREVLRLWKAECLPKLRLKLRLILRLMVKVV